MDRHDAVATLTLDRAEKRNALSLELIEQLEAGVAKLERDSALRAVVLTGAGKSFCAGMDLRGVLDDAAAMGRMLHGLSRVMRRIRRLSVPVIASVQGAAVGGGCGLMVVCDFAFTHPEAKLGYPEVSLGVCPAVVAPWLIQRIGAGRARAMLLAGGTISGREGYEIGLATALVPVESLPQAAIEFATALTRGGREAIAITKRWLNELDGSLGEEIYDRSADLSAQVIAGAEAQQRLAAVMNT